MDNEIKDIVVLTVLADNIKVESKRINVNDNELVLIKIPRNWSMEEAESLVEVIQDMSFYNDKFWLIPDDVELEKLSIEQLIEMRDSINAILHVNGEE